MFSHFVLSFPVVSYACGGFFVFVVSGCGQHEARKAVKAPRGILEAYIQDMGVRDIDRFIVLDLLPNRIGGRKKTW